MQYRINEGSIEIPDQLTDRTVNMLMTADGQKVSYTISRDKLQPSETLVQFLDRQIKELSRQVSKFTQIERQEIQFGSNNQTAYSIQSFFKQNGREFHQRQAVVLLADQHSVLIVTGTSFNVWSEADQSTWQSMLKHSQIS